MAIYRLLPIFSYRSVPETGGRHPTLCEAMYHGCEAGPTKLRSICLPRETGTADQEVPSDGGDGFPGPWHEGR